MFPQNETRNEGTFACSPVPQTETRVHADVFFRYQKPETRLRSPKPPFYETALLLPSRKLRKLSILQPIRFDIHLGAAKETHTQTATKTNGHQNAY